MLIILLGEVVLIILLGGVVLIILLRWSSVDHFVEVE